MLLESLGRHGNSHSISSSLPPEAVWEGYQSGMLPRELLLELEPSAPLAHDAFLTNLFSVAALTWLTYDMVLNFTREVTLVWKRWHEPKGRHSRRLYMIVRYFSVINLALYVGVNTRVGLSLDFCRAWYYVVVVNTTIITLLPDAMLLIRVNAVYGWNIRTLLFTSFLFMIQMTTGLVVGVLAVISTPSSPTFNPSLSTSLSPSIPGCPASIRRPVAQFTLVAWIPSVLAQLIYFLLMLNTLAHLMHGLDASNSNNSRSRHLNDANSSNGHPDGSSNNHTNGQKHKKYPNALSECAHMWSAFSCAALRQVQRLVPTMMVFVGHGGLYFGFAILAKVVNMLIVTTLSGPLQAAAIPWTLALYPILVTRIYLSMVQYLHFGLPMRRPWLLASYDGENYFGFDGDEELVVVGGDEVQNDRVRTGEEGVREDRRNNLTGGRRQRQSGLGRITFAVRNSESLTSLASTTLIFDPVVLDFRDEEY